MFFTRSGLEMATHERIAGWHASRFAKGEPVADLTCGIGADLIALARRGPAVGIDTDPEHVWCAEMNLSAHGVEAQVTNADCTEWFWANRPGSVLIDPARRDSAGRKHRAEDYSPGWSEVERIAGSAKRCLVKLSPMLPDSVLESLGGELSFVSFGGECREAAVFVGGEVGRWAVHVESGQTLGARELESWSDDPEGFVFEADPAAVRAHTLGAFGLAGLGDSNGYLTGNVQVSSVWLTGFEVLWSGAFREKEITRVCRESGVCVAAVKVRGAKVDPVAVKRSIGAKSGAPGEVLVWKSGEKVRAALVRRLASGRR